jgi:hypothetical protein
MLIAPRKKNYRTIKILEVAGKHRILGISVKFKKKLGQIQTNLIFFFPENIKSTDTFCFGPHR